MYTYLFNAWLWEFNVEELIKTLSANKIKDCHCLIYLRYFSENLKNQKMISDYTSMKVAQLRALCKSRGLPADGTLSMEAWS